MRQKDESNSKSSKSTATNTKSTSHKRSSSITVSTVNTSMTTKNSKTKQNKQTTSLLHTSDIFTPPPSILNSGTPRMRKATILWSPVHTSAIEPQFRNPIPPIHPKTQQPIKSSSYIRPSSCVPVIITNNNNNTVLMNNSVYLPYNNQPPPTIPPPLHHKILKPKSIQQQKNEPVTIRKLNLSNDLKYNKSSNIDANNQSTSTSTLTSYSPVEIENKHFNNISSSTTSLFSDFDSENGRTTPIIFNNNTSTISTVNSTTSSRSSSSTTAASSSTATVIEHELPSNSKFVFSSQIPKPKIPHLFNNGKVNTGISPITKTPTYIQKPSESTNYDNEENLNIKVTEHNSNQKSSFYDDDEFNEIALLPPSPPISTPSSPPPVPVETTPLTIDTTTIIDERKEEEMKDDRIYSIYYQGDRIVIPPINNPSTSFCGKKTKSLDTHFKKLKSLKIPFEWPDGQVLDYLVEVELSNPIMTRRYRHKHHYSPSVSDSNSFIYPDPTRMKQEKKSTTDYNYSSNYLKKVDYIRKLQVFINIFIIA